jgi:endonuclease/exonuclease/phosphatase (EEP) superfamily protein YafD
MAFTVLASGVGVANLHASGRPQLAEVELRAAADRAAGWSGERPLILGGDFNLRPARTTVFDELERRHGLRPATGAEAIDHLLARGLEVVSPPASWPPAAREVEIDGLAVRLSDHAPVAAAFRVARRVPRPTRING